MTQQRQVINSLSRGEFELVSEPMRIYYRDIYDHVVRVEDFAQNLRDLLDSALNIYLSSVYNRMNEIMKVLTLVASIFIPLTLIAGIYGMNFENMPELATEWGYPVVLVAMLLIGIGMVLYFRKKRWM
jgi:magnesium transporter